MDIYRRDAIIQLLRNELDKQKTSQTEQMKHILTETRDNEFLREIKRDYKNHYDYMLQQQLDKEMQLYRLIEYLEKSIQQGQLTQTLLLQTKDEKRRLVEEIDNVRREIDELMMDNARIIGQ